jgi:hypothetical protein
MITQEQVKQVRERLQRGDISSIAKSCKVTPRSVRYAFSNFSGTNKQYSIVKSALSLIDEKDKLNKKFEALFF